MEMATVTLRFLKSFMAKNPYWVNKGVLMTSKVPSGMLNYETYQIFLLSNEDKQRNNLLGCTSTMMVTLKMGYTTMVPQPPIQVDEISSTTSDDEDYHSDGIRLGTNPCQYRTGEIMICCKGLIKCKFQNFKILI